MATQVYIITKEGRGYTDEGLHYIEENLQKNFSVDPTTIEFNSGAIFNKPDFFARQLAKHENAYIVLSAPKSTIFIPKRLNTVIIEDLTNYPETSSWETLMICCKEPME